MSAINLVNMYGSMQTFGILSGLEYLPRGGLVSGPGGIPLKMVTGPVEFKKLLCIMVAWSTPLIVENSCLWNDIEFNNHEVQKAVPNYLLSVPLCDDGTAFNGPVGPSTGGEEEGKEVDGDESASNSLLTGPKNGAGPFGSCEFDEPVWNVDGDDLSEMFWPLADAKEEVVDAYAINPLCIKEMV
jgi:hypothetical protein